MITNETTFKQSPNGANVSTLKVFDNEKSPHRIVSYKRP